MDTGHAGTGEVPNNRFLNKIIGRGLVPNLENIFKLTRVFYVAGNNDSMRREAND